jgi:RimJ/RimL family protein N-acetyltransferase
LEKDSELHTEEVSPEDHARWFRHMIINRRRNIRCHNRGRTVGIIRFDWNPGHDACEISMTVAPEHRGKGVGFAMAEIHP